jgi:hypothetical protein
MEERVVTSVGISVNTLHGEAVNARLQKAMSDAVLACNAEGISTDEANSEVIRKRMTEAHDAELAKIFAEQNA